MVKDLGWLLFIAGIFALVTFSWIATYIATHP